MKKVICLLMVASMCLAMTACGESTPSTSSAAQSSKAIASSSMVASSSQTEQTKFEQFESGLDKLNIKYEKVNMVAQIIGAEQGIKYKLSDGNVELYKFDKESDDYKKVVKNKAVTVSGLGDFSVELNDNMALVFDDNVKEKSDIENLFKSLK